MTLGQLKHKLKEEAKAAKLYAASPDDQYAKGIAYTCDWVLELLKDLDV